MWNIKFDVLIFRCLPDKIASFVGAQRMDGLHCFFEQARWRGRRQGLPEGVELELPIDQAACLTSEWQELLPGPALDLQPCSRIEEGGREHR